MAELVQYTFSKNPLKEKPWWNEHTGQWEAGGNAVGQC